MNKFRQLRRRRRPLGGNRSVNLTVLVAIGPGVRRRALAFRRELLELFGGFLIPALTGDLAVEAGMGEQAFDDFRLRHRASAEFENNLL